MPKKEPTTPNAKNLGGRPPLSPNDTTVFVGCKMASGLADNLESIASQLGLPSRSDLIRETLADFVKNFRKTA